MSSRVYSVHIHLRIKRWVKPLLLVALILATGGNGFGQRVKENLSANEPLHILDLLKKRAYDYSENHPLEKVYLHFDKPFYTLGEESWYKAYIISGPDLDPTDISSVLYVDWIDPSGTVVRHQRLKIDGGAAAGSFRMDPTFIEGTYTVRAYTNWMRNDEPELFFSRKIQVLNPKATQSRLRHDSVVSPIDLQFFPEGGTLVAGIKTQIAFRAIDVYAKGVNVKCDIFDDRNNFITSFRSVHNGMGVFPFIAEAQRSYRAVIQGGETFALPKPTDKGLVLASSGMHEGKIFVKIQSDPEYKAGAYLIGHSNGSVCYAAYVKTNFSSTDLSIPKEALPEGVLQLTLLNNEGIPQCERMVFVRKDREMVVTFAAGKDQFSPRDSVTVRFKVADTNGTPAEASLSVSVTDAGFISADDKAENIFTQLLLQSDLRGHIEDPGWYFSSQSAEKKYALDLVMLTHGWSRYNWQKILSGSDTLSFVPEGGITIEGKIVAGRKPVRNALFLLTIPQPANDYVNIYESDSLGHFSISGLDFSDSTMIAWRVMKKKGVIENAEIQLTTMAHIPPVPEHLPSDQMTDGIRNELFEENLARFMKTGVWSPDSSRTLDEVVIEARRMEVSTIGSGGIGIKPSPEDGHLPASQLIARYAGKPPKSIRINGNLIYSIAEKFNIVEGDPFTILNNIQTEEIEYLVVYGNIHRGYSFSIFTKNTASRVNPGTIRQKVKGYDVVREFYHPKYGPSDAYAMGPDNRMTLYWNANLRTDKAGNATIKFYNNDSAQKLLITLEGLANGLTISKTKTIGVSE